MSVLQSTLANNDNLKRHIWRKHPEQDENDDSAHEDGDDSNEEAGEVDTDDGYTEDDQNDESDDQSSDSLDEDETYTHAEVAALLRFYLHQQANESQVEE